MTLPSDLGALVQEVVYGELLPSERTQLHAAYATALGGGAETTDGAGNEERQPDVRYAWR